VPYKSLSSSAISRKNPFFAAAVISALSAQKKNSGRQQNVFVKKIFVKLSNFFPPASALPGV
jgi:hypothetical protein